MPFTKSIDRRQLLQLTALILAAQCVPTRPAWSAVSPRENTLSLYNIHTNEELCICYSRDGEYQPSALAAIDHLMRDYRTNEIKPIDPGLLDLLHGIATQLQTRSPFRIISGYRSLATNNMLRQRSGKVAKHSLHMAGQAADIHLPGIDLRRLRQVAMAMQVGGVGFYPESGFVHVDTGRIR